MSEELPTIYILNGSLQRLSELNVYTSTCIDVSMQPQAGAVVAYVPIPTGCADCKIKPDPGDNFPEPCCGCRWWWPDLREAKP